MRDTLRKALTEDRFWAAVTDGSHVRREALWAYAELSLPEEDMTRIDAHIADCVICRDALLMVDRPGGPAWHAEEPADVSPEAESRQPIEPRNVGMATRHAAVIELPVWRRPVAVAGAMLALAAALLIFAWHADPKSQWKMDEAHLVAFGELAVLSDVVGHPHREDGQGLVELAPRLVRPGFVAAFAEAVIDAARRSGQGDLVERWERVARQAGSARSEEARWGQWAVRVAYTDDPPPSALKVDTRRDFVAWAEPHVAGRPRCTADLAALLAPDATDVALHTRRVVECLVTHDDRIGSDAPPGPPKSVIPDP